MRNALWEFKSEFYVQRPDWMDSDTQTEKWRNNADCCSWDGVSCDPKTGHVVALDLWNNYFSYPNSLNGPLRSNSSLFKLQHLQNLDLTRNNLSGILPDSIGDLKYLKNLSLSDCNLFGKIPYSHGNLSSLTHLDLSFNDLTGEIPASMGNLNYLASLQLDFNKLSGNFPHVILNLSELTNIRLGRSRSRNKKKMMTSQLSWQNDWLKKRQGDFTTKRDEIVVRSEIQS
ncbi:unnamed protein product [Thlaspi arvense]|uniref:Leucine-rich repeat-containing N-terminal plant-type domain-containing protein n=1 Tax=Thlaspi arvense TaxID=13288 RepID=A0AAU9T9R6_THLAR|nr:unnamed protein product [Thlaspi arvense]